MARRNKKLLKLRQYRDKLIADNVNLRQDIRTHEFRLSGIRKALQQPKDRGGAILRAYAMASDDEGEGKPPLEFIEKSEAVAELTLVYKMLVVEREYTEQMTRAAGSRDLLRIAALTADHLAEATAHDKMLSTWGVDHGFTKSLRDDC